MNIFKLAISITQPVSVKVTPLTRSMLSFSSVTLGEEIHEKKLGLMTETDSFRLLSSDSTFSI